MDFNDTDCHDLMRVHNALLEAREKIVELSDLLTRVDGKLSEMVQLQGHPPAMCDVVAQMSKNKKLDRMRANYKEAAVPAVVLVKKG